VGEKLAETLAKLEIRTVGDLLTHYPHRYEDRSRFATIAQVRDGETALLSGKVTAVENRPTSRGLVLTRVSLDDGSKTVATLVWFNQWRLKQTFEKLLGKKIVAYGTIKRGYAAVEMPQPEWEALPDGSDAIEGSLALGRIVPIYPATEGIAQGRLRRFVFDALAGCADAVAETLPRTLRERRALPDIATAVRQIHFPDSSMTLDAARRRLAYDELLLTQLWLAGRRQAVRAQPGIAFTETSAPVQALRAVLPFTLTGAQERVIQEIGTDMAAPVPMNRLVQGDVGSGKTAVAMAAMAIAAQNGYQAALMAPTEILAEQHLRGIRERLEALELRVDLMTGSRPAREKAAVRARLLAGETQVVVGTHALIQEGIEFARLGLVVIDEQHRFGVLQRAALTGKGTTPDVLVMTATPIPRTLTLTVYGDLDVSVLDELPPGRKPIKTHWRRSEEKASVYEGVRRLLAQGRQAYVVCPLVEESEKLEVRAATDLAEHLTRHVFPEFAVGLLHGRMKGDEKESVMARFRAGEVHVLVATTVIEVGVDVPNAAVMVIEDADRFGLAQLHQLRGRVGRGEHASFCVLIADPKGPDGERRMAVMTRTNDGFQIAEEDLALRGPGEFFGLRQSGSAGFRMVDVRRDIDLLIEARTDAFEVLERDPRLQRPENRPLRDAVMFRKRAVEWTATA
jgi:ATP-dependent DNA helicase RecG